MFASLNQMTAPPLFTRIIYFNYRYLIRLESFFFILSPTFWFTATLFSASIVFATNNDTREKSVYEAFLRSYPRLDEMLLKKELTFGSPLFIRIFKHENELEVWLREDSGRYRLLKTYAICFHSGTIGPKLKEGDLQSPEGFYSVEKAGMNPWSKFHLAINVGYPNSYDLFHERTGGDLMIHGNCSSSGCFAMTNYYMDELYTIADAAFSAGQQKVHIHIFPFRFTNNILENYRGSRWIDFWQNLKEGYDFFEKTHVVPEVGIRNGRYVFSQ